MENTEIKTMISERLGVPVCLLTGETPEEDLACAKAVLAFKREYEQTREKSNAEKFEEWFCDQMGIERPDQLQDALSEVEEAVRVSSGVYPNLSDRGEAHLGDNRSTKEKFAEWMGDVMAFDPKKGDNGWKTIL